MLNAKKTILLLTGVLLCTQACAQDEFYTSNEPVVLAFDVDWANPEPLYSAWSAARSNPAIGVDFDFPVVSEGLEPNDEVRLYVGRSTTEGSALEAGGDVILADPLLVSTAAIDEQGRAAFGALNVTEGTLSSGTNTIRYGYLCGTTVIVVRAFSVADGSIPGGEFRAATWFYQILEPCE